MVSHKEVEDWNLIHSEFTVFGRALYCVQISNQDREAKHMIKGFYLFCSPLRWINSDEVRNPTEAKTDINAMSEIFALNLLLCSFIHSFI